MINILYLLCCDSAGFFPEQIALSIHTLIKKNPGANVLVILDNQTMMALDESRLLPIKAHASLIVRCVPEQFNTPFLRSRYLKTSLLDFVSGSFLYLDSDTIICDSIDLLECKKSPIAMVSDLNGPLLLKEPATLEKCKNAGFCNLFEHAYFNSGVMFVQDTDTSRHLFREWHRLWKESALRGVPYDQPALAEANRILGGVVTELPGEWNCQFKTHAGEAFISKAKVLHYFSPISAEATPFQIKELLSRVSRFGTIDPVVDSILSGKPEDLATFWGQKTDNALRFLGSPMFRVFVEDSPIFRFSSRFANFFYRLKRSLHNLLLRRK